jgi:biopolymer transport protein ExbD
MVDVFTVLLVFLLKSYSAEGTLTPSAPVRLPDSTATLAGDRNLSVTITEKELFLERTRIDEPTLLSADASEIPGLTKALDAFRRPGPAKEETTKVIILGDKEIPYFLLKKVLSTLTNSGFHDISLAVNQKSGQF